MNRERALVKLLLVTNKVKCDCCDDKPKQSAFALVFNKSGDKVYMCGECIEEFRKAVRPVM